MVNAKKVFMEITVQDEKGNRRKEVVSIDKLITNLQLRVRTLEEKTEAIVKAIDTVSKNIDAGSKYIQETRMKIDALVKELEKMKK